MNDGEIWRDIRSWFVRSMRSIGFARREMAEFIQLELVEVLKQLGNGGVKQMKPFIIPAVVNILWKFASGKRLDDQK